MSIHHPLRFNWHQFEGAGIDSSAPEGDRFLFDRIFQEKTHHLECEGGGSFFQSTLLNPTYLLLRENYRFITLYINLLAFMFSEVYHDSHLTPKDRIAALSSKRNRAKLRKGRFGEGKKDFCPTGYEPKRTSWISICLEGGKPP